MNAPGNIAFPARIMVPTKVFLDQFPIVMAQTFHCYYFDLVSKSSWQGSILVKRKNLNVPQAMRNIRNILPRALNGGWHFSYMGGINRTIKKMQSIVEGNELVLKSNENLIDKDHIEEVMAKGMDLYNREGFDSFIPYNINNINLPILKEFIKKYPHFLREPEKYSTKT